MLTFICLKPFKLRSPLFSCLLLVPFFLIGQASIQKGIIIGHKGSALKRVGMEARKDLEKFFDKQVFIELYVKVNKNWRNNAQQLKRFGYNN